MNTLQKNHTNTKLTLRTTTLEPEISLLRDALNKEHYLKAGRPAGHTLWQGVYRSNLEEGTQELVAVLCWGGAAKSLKPRDQWLGWDRVTCANRLKLIAQLRRFIVLESAREPNLASQCLALSLRTLASEWEKVHGYQPLLAESFHDPKIHQGTLYKVTNWIPLGLTKGFKRHRADFYQDTQSPKQLWVKPLKKQSPYLLCQPHALPAQHQKGIAEATAGARCALTCKQLRSINDIFWDLPDPRHVKTRRHPFGAMLTLICYGLLCGASNVKSIWKKCGALNQNQRRAIGLTQRHIGSGRLMMPGYDCLNDLVNKVSPEILGNALNEWLSEHSDQLPKSLSIDGKDLGGKGKLGAVVSLVHHSNGQPLAMRTYSGAKDDCELPVSQRMLENEQLDLANSVVTGDALLAQKKTSLIVTQKGGDYIWGLKDNQPTLYKEAKNLLDKARVSHSSEVENGHGRIEQRELRRVNIESSINTFSQAQQYVSVTRYYTEKKTGEDKTDTRHFITSLSDEEATPKRLAALVRGHWSIENKNHWKRDASNWREDRSYRRNPQGAKNLCLLRGALLALIPLDEHDSLNMAFEHYGAKQSEALNLLKKARPTLD